MFGLFCALDGWRLPVGFERWACGCHIADPWGGPPMPNAYGLFWAEMHLHLSLQTF
jgi:hypothetical protein